MTDTAVMTDEEKARAHLTVVAFGLVRRFGAGKAASLMLGATAGIVEHELKQPPAEWFAEMASAYEEDGDGGGGIFKQQSFEC